MKNAKHFYGIDSFTQGFTQVKLFGVNVLFTDERIISGSIPDGWFAYDIRHSDGDWIKPIEITRHNGVIVNFYGTIISPVKIPFDMNLNNIDIHDEDWIVGELISNEDLYRYLLTCDKTTEFRIPTVRLWHLKKDEDIKKKFKVFIAQPMHGLNTEAINKQRRIVKVLLENLVYPDKYIFLVDQVNQKDPVELKYKSETEQRLFRLGRSIYMMSSADLVIFMPDALEAKGCNVELAVCEQYGIKYKTFDEILKDVPSDKLKQFVLSSKWLWLSDIF